MDNIETVEVCKVTIPVNKRDPVLMTLHQSFKADKIRHGVLNTGGQFVFIRYDNPCSPGIESHDQDTVKMFRVNRTDIVSAAEFFNNWRY